MKNEEATCFGTIRKEHNLSTRGFCFIAPDDGGEDVFAHVCDFAFTGTVKSYSFGQGFGFIAPDSTFLDDVYVNESNLRASGIDKLETGDRVSFELLPNHPAHPSRSAVNLTIMEIG